MPISPRISTRPTHTNRVQSEGCRIMLPQLLSAATSTDATTCTECWKRYYIGRANLLLHRFVFLKTPLPYLLCPTRGTYYFLESRERCYHAGRNPGIPLTLPTKPNWRTRYTCDFAITSAESWWRHALCRAVLLLYLWSTYTGEDVSYAGEIAVLSRETNIPIYA